MSRFFLLPLLVVLAFSSAFAAVDDDEVTALPGYSGKLPQKHYSGLMAADDASTVFLHYWFVESAGNPKTDPLLIWLNGGPGCSSLEGFLYEQGPLHFTGNYTANKLPTLTDNPYAWTNVASVIFLESPAGVGFSYATNKSTATTDEITSQNNYGFLKNWYKGFPEYSKNPLFVTGESYAGIYVPTFVHRIYEGKQSGDNAFPLIGFAIGNACWGNAVGTCAMYGFMGQSPYEGIKEEMQFLHGHAMISAPHWQALVSACGNYTKETNECDQAIGEASNDGGYYNIYDIYDTCAAPVLPESGFARSSRSKTQRAPSALQSFLRRKHFALPQTPDTCHGPELAEGWLDNSEVQQALHISAANQSHWSTCAGIDYEKTVGSLLPLYPTLIKNYKVLVFSGDVDACVPHTGTEGWVRSLGYKVKQEWQPWLVNDQVAGYVVEYDAENQFTFLTVKGAGHMVPEYMPQPALELITRWLAGKPF